MFNRSLLAAFMGLALALGACSASTNDDNRVVTHDPGTSDTSGTLTLTWTVSGSTDPLSCDDLNADSMEVLLSDADGDLDPVYVSCSDFGTTIELDPGSYDADLTLVDADNNAVSSTLHLSDLVIRSDTDLTSDTDFLP